jgi:glutathione synthase/RimK-type ligase-like ATP-grasp enzyme
VVYKLFEGTEVGFFETRRLAAANLSELWRVRTCPLIFQEFTEGAFDVRATVVGDQVFASRIDFNRDSEIIDSRFTMVSTSPLDLPHEIQSKVVAITRGFGLVYAALDLRYSETDGFTFFELNPEGQYLWNEIEAGLPISRAIALRLFDG